MTDQTTAGGAKATSAQIDNDCIVVTLEDGRVIHAPVAWFPRLVGANPEDVANIRLIAHGRGLHWPNLDEHLSVRGMLVPPSRRSY